MTKVTSALSYLLKVEENVRTDPDPVPRARQSHKSMKFSSVARSGRIPVLEWGKCFTLETLITSEIDDNEAEWCNRPSPVILHGRM